MYQVRPMNVLRQKWSSHGSLCHMQLFNVKHVMACVLKAWQWLYKLATMQAAHSTQKPRTRQTSRRLASSASASTLDSSTSEKPCCVAFELLKTAIPGSEGPYVLLPVFMICPKQSAVALRTWTGALLPINHQGNASKKGWPLPPSAFGRKLTNVG